MSKFDDDMARGCLPTGEPLECLYGVGWWTEHDEPEPDPYDLHIAELEAAQRWIPVSERLPELYHKVLVYCEHGYTTIVTVLNHEAGLFPFDNVTHWMPIPQPPEVQE